MKTLLPKILIGAALTILALGLIALGYFTGPKRFNGPQRQLTINNTLIISTNATQTVNIIILDQNDQPWGCSTLTASRTASSITTGGTLPPNIRLRVALGGTIVNTVPGGNSGPVSGVVVQPIQGSVEFSGSNRQSEAWIPVAGSIARVKIAEREYGAEIVVNSSPSTSVRPGPVAPKVPAPPAPQNAPTK